MKDNYTKAPTHVVEWVCITDTTSNETTATNSQGKCEPKPVSAPPNPIYVEKARRDPSFYIFMSIVLLFVFLTNRSITTGSREGNVATASFANLPNQIGAIKEMISGGDSKNPYAPIAHGKLSADELGDFVDRFAPVAIAEMNKYGIPASIKIAQGIIESRGGKSKLARENNNHFGMKCFSRRCTKDHCTNATDDHHKDFFRKYKTAWESWRDHSLLLQGDRYIHLKKYKKDYKKWAKGLKKAGYATDKNYDKKLIDVIEHYYLFKLDTL